MEQTELVQRLAAIEALLNDLLDVTMAVHGLRRDAQGRIIRRDEWGNPAVMSSPDDGKMLLNAAKQITGLPLDCEKP